MVINWPGLDDKEKTELISTLSTTDNWILPTHPLGANNKSQPPLGESQRIARAEGKCSRHKGWWREGKDELASHSMTTEAWISTRGRISEATRIIIQEALEEETKKTLPLSVGKTSRNYIGPVQKQGFLASTTSQGQYMPQTDQMIGGSWELASSNWMNIGEAAAN